MSEPFLGEISIFAGDFAPRDWAFCNGQVLSIAQNTALFSLLGTTYGGNGTTTFALPNLTGAAPMHAGAGPGLTHRDRGEAVGSQSATVSTEQMPSHNHAPRASSAEDSAAVRGPKGAVWGSTNELGTAIFAAATNPVPMNPMALGATGGGQPHNNMQPYLGLNFIIALEGVFPQRP